MEFSSNTVAAAGGAARASSISQSRSTWYLAPEAHKELEIADVERMNLFLVGNGAAPLLADLLGPDLPPELILRWRPGLPLDLPVLGRQVLLILHDVDKLSRDDQHKLLRWLDHAAAQIRVVSTTEQPLWPRVKAGAFSDALYYRLNTVSVEMGTPAS